MIHVTYAFEKLLSELCQFLVRRVLLCCIDFCHSERCMCPKKFQLSKLFMIFCFIISKQTFRFVLLDMLTLLLIKELTLLYSIYIGDIFFAF